MGPESNEKWVSINPQAELVLKVYLDASVCFKEAGVYDKLAKSGFGFVPPCYGIYKNEQTGMLGILIGYLGESLEDICLGDRCVFI